MNHKPDKSVIVIVGPTAVGKTAAAIQLAIHFNTVVISADSRQFYREMSIGTAKPTEEELSATKHYFIDSHSINETFTAADFEKQGLALLDQLFKTKDVVILVGGSGLFIKAICEGFDDVPQAKPAVRERLNLELAEKGIQFLQEKLKIADPVYYGQVDIQNPRRVIRALEVFESVGKPYSGYRLDNRNKRPFHIIKIGLDLPRDILYNRINKRVDSMIEQGLVAEVESLSAYQQFNALNTVGYSEIFDYIDKKTNFETAIAQIKQNTRRFAKRQLTWFRKDKGIHWFEANELLYNNLADFLLDKF